MKASDQITNNQNNKHKNQKLVLTIIFPIIYITLTKLN